MACIWANPLAVPHCFCQFFARFFVIFFIFFVPCKPRAPLVCTVFFIFPPSKNKSFHSVYCSFRVCFLSQSFYLHFSHFMSNLYCDFSLYLVTYTPQFFRYLPFPATLLKYKILYVVPNEYFPELIPAFNTHSTYQQPLGYFLPPRQYFQSPVHCFTRHCLY